MFFIKNERELKTANAVVYKNLSLLKTLKAPGFAIKYGLYSVSQGFNFLAPLLVVPHLIKVVGIELLGIILLCQTVINYFTIIVDYHFNLIAVKNLALNRNNPEAIRAIFIETFCTRLILTLVSAVAFIIILWFYPLLKSHAPIAILSFSIVVGQLLINNWFFQGMEEFVRLSLLNIVSKVCYIIAVLIFVKTHADAILPNLLLGICTIAAGTLGMIYTTRKFAIHYSLPSFQKIVIQLKEGFPILLSNGAVLIYANSAIFILGLFVVPTILGAYGIADKIITICRALVSIYFVVSFPRVSLLFASSKKLFLDFYKKYFIAFAGFITLVSLFLFFGSKTITGFFTQGNSSNSVSLLLKLAAIIPLFVCLNIPAYQILILCNRKKIYTGVLISASLLSLALFSFLIPIYQAFGAMYAIIITELYVTVALWAFANKQIKWIKHEASIRP